MAVIAAMFGAAATAAVPAWAQAEKAITLVVGFAPGGTSSIVAHYLATGLQAKLNRSVIVENKLQGARRDQYGRGRGRHGSATSFV